MRVLVPYFLYACLSIGLAGISDAQRMFTVDGDDYYNDISSDEEDNYPQKASVNDGE